MSPSETTPEPATAHPKRCRLPKLRVLLVGSPPCVLGCFCVALKKLGLEASIRECCYTGYCFYCESQDLLSLTPESQVYQHLQNYGRIFPQIAVGQNLTLPSS